MEIIESPFMAVVADLAKNAEHITPKLQNAIAQFLRSQSAPIFKLDYATPKGKIKE